MYSKLSGAYPCPIRKHRKNKCLELVKRVLQLLLLGIMRRNHEHNQKSIISINTINCLF